MVEFPIFAELGNFLFKYFWLVRNLLYYYAWAFVGHILIGSQVVRVIILVYYYLGVIDY